MRILVIGSKGLLGTEIIKHFKEKNVFVIEADLPEYDIFSESLANLFWHHNFDFVINCAAYTNVPKAETDQFNALKLNVEALVTLSSLCVKYGVGLIHFSTDFVFDGEKNTSYTELDPPNPKSFYGLSKLFGERIINRSMQNNNYTIFRLQWLYGNSPKTFFNKVLDKVNRGETLNIVNDEFGAPCSVSFVASVLYKYLTFVYNPPALFINNLSGETYNLTHDDSCSRYECAKYLFKLLKIDYPITPIINAPMDVKRPKNGVMYNLKLRSFLEENLIWSWKEDLKSTYAK